MLGVLNKKTSPIGLDIGHSSIKMLQLASWDDKIGLYAFDEMPVNPEVHQDQAKWREFIIATLKEMVSRVKFRGTNVVVSLPNNMLDIKSLRLDTTDDKEIDELIKTEIAERFEMKPSVDQIRYMVAGKVHHGDEMKNEVIFFASENENITNYLSMIEDAELTPVAIDPVPCALFRCLEQSLRRAEDRQLITAIVDIGYMSTTVVLGRGHDVVFVKQIPIAGKMLNEEVASRLGITIDEAISLRSKVHCDAQLHTIDQSTVQAVIDAMRVVIEQIAREISLCFKYYAVTFRGEKPSEVVVAGGEAYEKTLVDLLKSQLGVNIRPAQPLREIDLSASKLKSVGDLDFCEWAVPVGLSVKGWNMAYCGNKNHERN